MRDDPGAALAALAACETPRLIGVRHHSPACAAALPALLDASPMETLFLELPVDFEPWLPWLARPELEAPVALAGGRPGGEDLLFYPFADFSPELVAVRWAAAHGVRVVPFDLPVLAGTRREGAPGRPPPRGVDSMRITRHPRWTNRCVA